VGLAAGLGFANTADASLTVDLRLADGSKSVVASQGQKILADIWATVDGAATDLTASYGLSSVNGSIVSQGPLAINIAGKKGDLDQHNKVPLQTTGLRPFVKGGQQAGTEQDLDGDGDIDLGAPNQAGATGFFIVRADPQEYFGAPSGAAIAAPDGSGVQWKIGRVELTVMENDGQANVVFMPRRNAAGAVAPEAGLWFDDQGGLTAKDASSGTFISGAPLVVLVPEPGVIGTLALGALGLLARRRK
jgi:hypothetical protein